ncbi:DUF4865 family protein [Plantactinospora endophytica]|uniref:DUF4865 domain-containing protein n=1 Tax=Plantactinospora endophytica TaxID=673535 RepID=A0ABQ4EAL6_9ACTN|nr:DUF4865 family protein [Plantactinospora endophytica]GIG91770.1 DUF4865 domain-containing protein [Plantactinospora endophytica]
MYAKQYEITLPADYDMRIIRKRVADFGHLLDDRAGLALKAYLIRERGVDGSPVNEYAPFYLWHDIGAMAQFLVGGGGFQGIVRDFGRPVVGHWTGLATFAGPARETVPSAASRRLTAIPADADPEGTGLGLADRVEREIAELATLAGRANVHTAVLAVDPRHWQLLRLVLWNGSVPEQEEATERYQVAHLSAPGLADLPDGRHW